jgi:hypothetical protein
MNQISNGVIVKKSSYTTYTYLIVSYNFQAKQVLLRNRTGPVPAGTRFESDSAAVISVLSSSAKLKTRPSNNRCKRRSKSTSIVSFKTFLILSIYRSQIKKPVQRYDFQKPNIQKHNLIQAKLNILICLPYRGLQHNLFCFSSLDSC